MVSLEAKKAWRDACENDLKPHLAFLCEKMKAEPEYLATYGADTQNMVKAAMTRYGVTSPDCKMRKS